MNIILIGFMGSGKTAVGKILADRKGLNFLDIDQLIEQAEGRTISDIFAQEGEAAFREIETEVLKTLQDYDNFVLSTGGGIVLKAENTALLKSMGKVVLLRAEPEIIFGRTKNASHRPLLQVADPQGEINKILSARMPLYQQAADFVVDTSHIRAGEVAEEIIKWLK